MSELIREFTNTVEDGDTAYHAYVFAYFENGMWRGRIVFFPQGEGKPLGTEWETEQSDLEDVEYWASGLTYAYLEGALKRAISRRTRAEGDMPALPTRPKGGRAADTRNRTTVPIEVETVDDSVVTRIFQTRHLKSGLRRSIEGGGVLVLEDVEPPADTGEPGHYRLQLQFGSRNAAGIAGNWLWSQLHEQASVKVDGEPVEMRNAALRDALLAHSSAS